MPSSATSTVMSTVISTVISTAPPESMTHGAAVERVYRRMMREGEAFSRRVSLESPSECGVDVRGVDVRTLADTPQRAAGLVEEAQRRIEQAHGVLVPAYVAATRVLHDYAWPASLLVTAPWFLMDVLPVPGPGDVVVEPASGLLHVRPPREIREGAGPGEVRRVVADHHAPLLEALAPHLRRGHRAAWGTVADDMVSGLWWLGRLLGQEKAAVAAATTLLPSRAPGACEAPLPGEAGFRTIIAEDGSEHVTRTRVACCLQYVVEPEACITCPRTADAERRRRLAD